MKDLEELEEKIASSLEKKGFRVVRRGLIDGISGVKHFFDLVVEDPESGSKLAISLSDRISFEHLLSMLAVKMDVRVDHLIIAKEIDSRIVELLQKMDMFSLILGGKLSLIGSSTGSAEELVLEVIAATLKRRTD